jgi:hypothetical protein
MAKPNELEQAGLELMRLNGMPLTKREKPGRGGPKLYDRPDGQTVLVRTCVDRRLLTRSLTPDQRMLDIEKHNADWLLIVIPSGKRAAGKVEAYLVPSKEAAEEVKTAHKRWLDADPQRTSQTPVLRFDEKLTRKWEHHRLSGEPASTAGTASPLQEEIAAARRRIAALAGVPHEAVQVTIQFAS